ncbi:glycosyltransferase [Alcaligenaceae bacterium]|nr:glycosyltransferase [Alcaligenaceae bacterium]
MEGQPSADAQAGAGPHKGGADSGLHVVHIISGLGQGGAETVLHRLVAAPGQPAVHTVISLGGEDVFGPRLRAAGVQVHALRMKDSPLAAPAALWRLRGLLKRLRPDVVQTWMYHADLLGGVVARLAGIRAIAWGIRNSGADLRHGSRSGRAVAWLCARLSRWIPGVIVACADDAARRHREWGYDADRMLVIPNGYDMAAWRPDDAARDDLRGEWGVEPDTVLIGSVARWNPLKDHANLLDAFARSLKLHPGLRCVLVGQGMDAGNTELASMLRQHGIQEQVMLLGRRDDVPRILNALDVYVLSSRAEGFPNVVAEAMATGLPCVVTDVGDAARIVGDCGWVVPPRDAQALAAAIGAAAGLLESGEGRGEHMSRARRGRERVEQHYGLETMRRRYQTVWSRLAADYPARRPAAPGPGAPAVPRPRKEGYVPLSVGAPAAAAARAEPVVASRRLLFLVNNPAFFLSHRLPIAMAARASGFDVHVVTMDGPAVAEIRGHGLTHHIVPMSRSGRHPLQELRSLHAFWKLFRRLRPDLVHAVTIKPVLYGGIAARLAGVPAYVAAVSGLGFIFMRREGGFDALRLAATLLYRLALGHRNSRVVFQNAADRSELRRAGVVQPGQTVMIRGSGVDLDAYPSKPEPEGAPIAIMVARLLTDKGVREFVEAARMTAGHPSGLRWVLVGGPDPGNPASITEEEFGRWQEEGVVICTGERADVAELYQNSHIAVLPSYREGLPRSLVEAAACGRAVVTTDVPGCRDAIEPGATGLLVPPRDARALADAVLELATDAPRRRAMGAAGRKLAERAFDIEMVVAAHLAVYGQLLDPEPCEGSRFSGT